MLIRALKAGLKLYQNFVIKSLNEWAMMNK